MQRSPWLRAIILLWGLWFTGALIEAPGVHACAVHSTAAMGHMATSHSGAASAPDHEAHAQHGVERTDSSRQACQCTCLGVCCSASAPPPKRVAALSEVPTISRTRLVPIPSDRAPAPLRRFYEQPFANGPPSIV